MRGACTLPEGTRVRVGRGGMCAATWWGHVSGVFVRWGFFTFKGRAVSSGVQGRGCGGGQVFTEASEFPGWGGSGCSGCACAACGGGNGLSCSGTCVCGSLWWGECVARRARGGGVSFWRLCVTKRRRSSSRGSLRPTRAAAARVRALITAVGWFRCRQSFSTNSPFSLRKNCQK